MIIELAIVGGLLWGGQQVRHLSSRRNKFLEIISAPPNTNQAEGKLQAVVSKLTTVPLFTGAEYRQKLEEMSSDSDKQARQLAEKENNQDILIVVASLALTTAGYLIYWPLVLLGIPGLLYTTRFIQNQAYQALKKGQVNVYTMVSMWIIGGLLAGWLLMVPCSHLIFLLSRKVLLKVINNSQDKLVNVFRQRPDFVWILVDGVEMRLAIEALSVNDIVVVHGGEVIPVDGIVKEGLASVGQQILTGEAKPVDKGVGDPVFAATLVLAGRLYIQAEKMGTETTAAKIGQILNQTAAYKATTQLQVERLANQTVAPTLALGAISLPFLGVSNAVAILNAHFKDQMSLVAPISIMNFLNLASQNSLLIKDGRTFDGLNQVDTIVFDKTGTLTEEQPHIAAIHGCANHTKVEVLLYTAIAEQKQQHPIAQAILKQAKDWNLQIPEMGEIEYKLGYGLVVTLRDKVIHVGSKRYIETVGLEIPPSIQEIEQECHIKGHSLVIVAVNQQVIGAIELEPTIRPEAKAVIAALRKRRNIKATYLISGDHEEPTRALAQELGLDHYYAETLPEQKAALIEQFQQEGKFICYIGDGINDAIAMRKSHVSVSLRGASTVATDTAQVVLMDQGLNHLTSLFNLAEELDRNLKLTFVLILAPTILGMGGIFLLGFGLPQTIILNLTGLNLGILNSMRPLLKR